MHLTVVPGCVNATSPSCACGVAFTATTVDGCRMVCKESNPSAVFGSTTMWAVQDKVLWPDAPSIPSFPFNLNGLVSAHVPVGLKGEEDGGGLGYNGLPGLQPW